MVSGQTPMVLKLNKHDCVAHSMSRREEALTTWRQTAAFPENEMRYKIRLFYIIETGVNSYVKYYKLLSPCYTLTEKELIVTRRRLNMRAVC